MSMWGGMVQYVAMVASSVLHVDAVSESPAGLANKPLAGLAYEVPISPLHTQSHTFSIALSASFLPLTTTTQYISDTSAKDILYTHLYQNTATHT